MLLRRLTRNRAFTLIELLVVILIIGILVAVAAPSFLGQSDKAHDSSAQQQLTFAYQAAKADAVNSDVQGNLATGDTLRSAVLKSEPQLTSALITYDTSASHTSDSISAGQLTVCSTSTATQLMLAGASKSNHEYLLQANANGNPGLRLARGTCAGFDPNATASATTTASAQPLIIFDADGGAGSTYNVYTVKADGTGVTQLTHEAAGAVDQMATWSPDHTKIVFASTRDNIATNVSEIYTMNADGTGITRLTTNAVKGSNWPYGNAYPSFSPDGTHILFQSQTSGPTSATPNGWDGFTYVREMNADGSSQTVASIKDVMNPTPSWKNNSTIAYVYQAQGASLIQLYTANPDGTNATNISNNPASDGQAQAPIIFGADGNLYFTRNVGGTPYSYGIFKMPASQANTTAAVKLPSPASNTFQPAVSPDGTKLAFATSAGNSFAAETIYAAKSDGSSPVAVSPAGWDAEHPAW